MILKVNTGWAFYCKNNIISETDAAAEVLAKCGDPASVYEWTEAASDGLGIVKKMNMSTTLITLRDETRTDSYAQWTYNFGPYQFLRVLTFKNGTLVKIEENGYGY